MSIPMHDPNMYCYAARLDDNKITGIHSAKFSHLVGKKWDIDFLIYVDYSLKVGIYDHDNGKRYYVSEITWVDYDMLIAFGVEGLTEFPALSQRQG